MIQLFLFLTLDKMVFAAGYIPNIQFAPFYLAAEKGYYRQEGLDIQFDYTIGPDVLKMVALDKAQVGSVDPDAFLVAVKRGLPLVHVATLYQKYPITLITREPLKSGTDLKGKTIGISGAYGASYLGLKAILKQLGLTLKDVHVKTIGYNQVAIMKQGRIDGVIGYINNEPVILKQQGMQVSTLMLQKGGQIPGVGIMTNQHQIDTSPALIQGFLRATFRGVEDVIRDPHGSFDSVVKAYLPQLENSPNLETTWLVFENTLPFLTSTWSQKHGLGQCAPFMWENLEQLMIEDNLLSTAHQWEEIVNRTFVLPKKETQPLNH